MWRPGKNRFHDRRFVLKNTIQRVHIWTCSLSFLLFFFFFLLSIVTTIRSIPRAWIFFFRRYNSDNSVLFLLYARIRIAYPVIRTRVRHDIMSSKPQQIRFPRTKLFTCSVSAQFKKTHFPTNCFGRITMTTGNIFRVREQHELRL